MVAAFLTESESVREIEIEREREKAWHIVSVLLSLGRPACAVEVSARCSLFRASADYVEFLCSIPESPLCLTGDRLVTISLAAFLAIGEFVRKSVSCHVARCTLRVSGPKRIWDDVVRTYYRKRKGQRAGANVFPAAKRRLLVHSEIGEGNQIMSISTHSLPSNSFEADAGICNDLIRKMNHLTGHIPVLEFDCSILTHEIPMKGAQCSNNVYFPSDALCKIEEVQNDFEEEASRNVHGRSEEYLRPQTQNHNLLGAEIDLNFPKSNVLEYQEPAPLLGMVENLCFHQETQIDQMQVGSSPLRVNCHVDNDFKDNKLVEDREQISCEDRCKLTNSGNRFEGQQDLDIGIVSSFTEKGTAKLETQSPFPLVKRHSGMKHQKISSTKLKRMHWDSTILQSQLPLKSVENKPITPKQKEKSKIEQNPTYIREKLKTSHNNNLLTKENRQDSASKNQSETKALPTFESFVIEEEEGSGGYGTVYKARRKNDGKTFAIKCPHANAHMHHVNNELKMLERFGGRNFVIKYEGSFKSGNADCFVLEHVQHDRPEVLKREIDVFQLRWYGYCMFRALASLHKQGIVHRDVKPGNFLFSRNFNKGYLIDFNLAMDLNQKYNSTNKVKMHSSNFDHVPLPSTKPVPQIKARKALGSKCPETIKPGTVKHSTPLLESKSMKKRIDRDHTKTYPEAGGRNLLKNQGADGSGITSAKDATSTRTPSAERIREPLPCYGRKELISLVQEAMQSPDHKAASVPMCQRKRVEAPPGKVDRKPVYLTPMPLHSSGSAITGAGLLKNKGDGKKKRDGPCVGTKGFRAPEVLFRSPYQGSKIDIWSAGVTLLYLIIGKTPFTGDPEQNIKDITRFRGSEDMWEVAKLHDREISFPVELYDMRSLPSVELEEWCKINTKRPDFLQAIPRSLFDLVDKCLNVNPRLRISAEDALRHEFFTPCHESLKKQRLLRQGQRFESMGAHHPSQGNAIELLEMMS